MTKDKINRWVFKIDLDDIVDDSIARKSFTSDTPCICCEKPIKNPKYAVHLLGSGHLVSSDEDFEDSQGFHAIGAGCRKKLPNNFIFEYPNF